MEPQPEILKSMPWETESLSESIIDYNVSKAIESAKKVIKNIKASDIWTRATPFGAIEIVGALLYNGIPVATITFCALNGEALPKGYNPAIKKLQISIKSIKKKFDEMIPDLMVLKGVEYREREKSFAVPISYKNRLLGHISVYSDGLQIVPDYLAVQEMSISGERDRHTDRC